MQTTNRKRKIWNLKRLKGAVIGAGMPVAAFLFSVPARAEGLTDSTVVTGTQKLISDVTTWLMILAPVVTVMLVIYFLIRRAAADEMDQKKWNNRIMVAVISCIGAVLASALVSLVIGYYQ